MKNDVDCPYCESPQEIDTGDSSVYSEGDVHSQQCRNCEKYYVFATAIHVTYDAEKADCLNGSEHDFKETVTYPKRFRKMRCSTCDFEKNLSTERLRALIAEDAS